MRSAAVYAGSLTSTTADNDNNALVSAGGSEAKRKAAAIEAIVAICEVEVCVMAHG